MGRGQAPGGLEDRILDAALVCVARWGVAKTTLDDVARQAGCSRATLYRVGPGGKDALMVALARREITRFRDQLGAEVDAAVDLEEALVVAITITSRRLADHAALQFLLAHEPEVVLPHVAFGRLDRLFAAAAAFATPHLSRFLPPAEAARAAEWVTRVILSYAVSPSVALDPADGVDARHLVRSFLLPGLVPSESEPVLTATLQGS